MGGLLCFGYSHGKKLQQGATKLIEAYTQRILPGRREGRVMQEIHFIIKWRNAGYPKDFFWVYGHDTLNCNIAKAHKAADNGGGRMHGRADYYTENTTLEYISAGDTLDITPVNAGSETPGRDLQQHLKSTLLYSVNRNRNLFVVRVDSIAKKRDIAMS